MVKKINYIQARKNLLEACQHYLAHNQAQLDGLMAQSSYWPEDLFFHEAIGKYKPAPGFNDWITCKYYQMLKDLLFNNSEHICNLSSYLRETWDRTRGNGKQEYQGLKFLRGFEARVNSEVDPVYHREPNIVLHNLQALVDLFRIILYKRGLNEHADCPAIKDKLLGALLNDNATLAQWQRTEADREMVLMNLLRSLSTTDSRLTVGDLLTATNVQFNPSERLLSFKLPSSDGPTKEIALKLDDRECHFVYELYIKSNGLSWSELFNDLISGIRRDDLPEKIRNLPLSLFEKFSFYSQSETSHQLLTYHREHSVGAGSVI